MSCALFHRPHSIGYQLKQLKVKEKSKYIGEEAHRQHFPWTVCCFKGCSPRVRGPGTDRMSTVIQNARDHITELVNIAIAYDLRGSFNTPAFQFVLKGIALRLFMGKTGFTILL